MSAIGGGGNYISDGSIMAWLALQQDRIYGDLRESMDLCEQRAEFTDALNDIKAHLRDANQNAAFGDVDAELQTFMAKYGATPEFAEICSGLESMANKIHGDYENAKDYDEKYAQYQKAKAAYDQAVAELNPKGLKNSAITLRKPEAPPEPIRSYSDESIKDWTNLIDGKMDVSSKNDQLTMIHIQELKATLDQGSQLASTFISSGDKTSSAIINNIA